jgi:hypothetical protein
MRVVAASALRPDPTPAGKAELSLCFSRQGVNPPSAHAAGNEAPSSAEARLVSMAPATDNKIFISWSGEASRSVAAFMKQWLEDVVDNVSVWFSEVDIAAGSRSMQDIEAALKDSRMGIIVTTKATMGKDWINFEAGALSKEVGGNKNYVVPLLVDFDKPTELVGPLNVFQAVTITKDGIQKLLSTVYEVIGGENKARVKIERYWTDIEDQVEVWRRAAQTAGSSVAVQPRGSDDLLAEVLAIVRELRDGNGQGVGSQPRITATFNSDQRLVNSTEIDQILKSIRGPLPDSLVDRVEGIDVERGFDTSIRIAKVYVRNLSPDEQDLLLRTLIPYFPHYSFRFQVSEVPDASS